MKDFYPPNRLEKTLNAFKPFSLRVALALLLITLLMPFNVKAQQEFTIIEGNLQSSLAGVTPFGTVAKNQRSQYLYVSTYLQNLNAPNGYITAVTVKITQTALPSQIQPHNLQIKMGLTSLISLPENLIPNLPVHYSKDIENITTTGWYTFTLDTPFSWDGYSNIVMEFCRTNEATGSNYEVEVFLNALGEYRTAALVTNNINGNGCTLEGNTQITLPNRRLIPSMRVTMTNPCETNPNSGTIVVSQGANYCGEPFTLSATGDSIESGLAYQWQSSFTGTADFVDIVGATSPSLTTTQEFATYYRRGIMCSELGVMIYPPALFVAGAGCLCAPTVTTVDAAGITNVSFGDINSTSTSAESYTNFTNLNTNVQRLASLPLSVRVTAVSEPMVTKAWIDWNQDGNFSETESYNLGMVNSGTDVSSGMIATVVPPMNAVLGSTKMRVRTASTNDFLTLLPCGNTVNGETEDYSITVQESLGIQDSEILKNSIIVFGLDKSVKIKSTVEEINSIRIYDLSGRILFYKNDVSDIQSTVVLNGIASQIVVVEVKTASGFVINKKVSLR